MTEILVDLVKNYPQLGYVQGMNFLAAGVCFHSRYFTSSSKILEFLFESMNLASVYCFKKFSTYCQSFIDLLQTQNPALYEYFITNDKLDFKIIILDWFFTLAFSKVPLDQSSYLLINLINLINHGWYFFYRLLLEYFNTFYRKHKTAINKSIFENDENFSIQTKIKTFYKDSSIEWSSLIDDCKLIKIDERNLSRSLAWSKHYLFHPLSV